MRAFVGIRLPEPVRASLAALQRALAGSGADVKWVEPANLHVTLKFLDEITESQRQAVDTLLTEVAAREEPFLLGIEGVGAFPSVSAPRVIWVGLTTGKERVARIAQAIEAGAAAISLRREDLPAPARGRQAGRPFSPHLTLGRVRSPRDRQVLTQLLRETTWKPPAPWQVSSLTLYQSVLSAAGPRYTVLADVPFQSR